MGIPLCVIFWFSFAAFNIFSLCLIFINLINMCLEVFPLEFILFGTLWVSWTWVVISFPVLRKFSTIISSIFSCPLFLFSSSDPPMILILRHLTLSQRSLSLSSFLLILFSFFHSASFISTILSSTLLVLSSASAILLLVPYRVLLISVIALFIIDCLLFISSRSLLNFSCICSILVSNLFTYNFILFSRFWIIFLIIILNSFSGRLPISSFVWFGGHLSCSFSCWIFLCLFNLFKLLCLGWPFCMLERFLFIVELAACGWCWTSDFSRFPGYGSLCRCFGGWRWISSFWSAVKSSSEFWGVYGFGKPFSSLYFNAQGCVPVLLEN